MTGHKSRLGKWLVVGHRFQNKPMKLFGGYRQIQIWGNWVGKFWLWTRTSLREEAGTVLIAWVSLSSYQNNITPSVTKQCNFSCTYFMVVCRLMLSPNFRFFFQTCIFSFSEIPEEKSIHYSWLLVVLLVYFICRNTWSTD